MGAHVKNRRTTVQARLYFANNTAAIKRRALTIVRTTALPTGQLTTHASISFYLKPIFSAVWAFSTLHLLLTTVLGTRGPLPAKQTRYRFSFINNLSKSIYLLLIKNFLDAEGLLTIGHEHKLHTLRT